VDIYVVNHFTDDIEQTLDFRSTRHLARDSSLCSRVLHQHLTSTNISSWNIQQLSLFIHVNETKLSQVTIFIGSKRYSWDLGPPPSHIQFFSSLFHEGIVTKYDNPHEKNGRGHLPPYSVIRTYALLFSVSELARKVFFVKRTEWWETDQVFLASWSGYCCVALFRHHGRSNTERGWLQFVV
jgi:hypothetical protein